MLWFIFALVSAVFSALAAIFSKKELFHKHALEFSTLRTMFIAIFSLVLLFFLKPDINFKVLVIVYFVAVVATFAIILSAKALRHLKISVYSPLMNVSPLFLLILASIFLGETISWLQLFGVLLILIGAYSVEADHRYKNFVAPFKKLIKSKYQLFAILAIIIFAFTSVFDRYIVFNFLNPLVYLCYIWIFIGFNFIVVDFFMFRLRDVQKDLKRNIFPIILIALFFFIANGFYVLAINIQYVSLVIPVRRLSTLFSTVIGGSLFHEKGIKFKIIACLVMIIGAYFVSL